MQVLAQYITGGEDKGTVKTVGLIMNENRPGFSPQRIFPQT